MIPRIIHYCWFGGNPLPDDAKKCIASWKKFCPNYAIVEWNENNFPFNDFPYAQEAYKAKKWAFVSDVARLYALVNYGGIYMDTDVEVIAPLDEFLNLHAFSGFEDEKSVPTGIMACEKSQPFFTILLNDYTGRHFINEDGTLDLSTNVTAITNLCKKNGLVLNGTQQTIMGFTLFPRDYFCPLSYDTGKLEITNNTRTIHWFAGSWKSNQERSVYKKAMQLRKIKVIGRPLSFIYEKGFNTVDTLHNEGIKGLKSKINQYKRKTSIRR